MRDKMIDYKVYGSSEEMVLKERVIREKSLYNQDKRFDRKTKVIDKLKATFERSKRGTNSFETQAFKEEKREIVKNNIEEGKETKCQSELKRLNDEQVLKAKVRTQRECFIQFVDDRLKGNDFQEVFELTKDEWDRVIFHAFSKQHSVRKVVTSSTKGEYEGIISADICDGTENCYYNFTYYFERDDLMNSYDKEFSSKNILCGFIITEDGNVRFLKDEIKIGSKSPLTTLYHNAEKVLDDMVKKQAETELNFNARYL